MISLLRIPFSGCVRLLISSLAVIGTSGELLSAPPESEHPSFISGSVLDPNGKPVAGARIYAVKQSQTMYESVEIAKTTPHGTFRAPRPLVKDGFVSIVLAQKEKFGVAWLDMAEANPEKLFFRLASDQTIRGRVVNTEGKPVAGVRVFVTRILRCTGEDVAPVLKAIQSGSSKNFQTLFLEDHLQNEPFLVLGSDLDDRMLNEMQIMEMRRVQGHKLIPDHSDLFFSEMWAGGVISTTTDVNGKFRLNGCGANRFVELALAGGGASYQEISVVNKENFDPAPFNQIVKKQQQLNQNPTRHYLSVHAPDVYLIADRAKQIEGVVLDAVTKKPIPGAIVSGPLTVVKTDKAGRFKLDDFHKAKTYMVHVRGPENESYVPEYMEIDDSEGFAPAKCELLLQRPEQMIKESSIDRLEAEVTSWSERVAWSQRMVKLGLMDNKQVETDKAALEEAKRALDKARKGIQANTLDSLEAEVISWSERVAWSQRMAKLGLMDNKQVETDKTALEEAKRALDKARKGGK